MRLTTKLVSWLFLSVVLAVGINGWHGVRSELERYESDLAERHVIMGRVLRAAFGEVMDTDGEARAVSMLDYTDKRIRLVDIRWVYLDEAAPSERKPLVALAALTLLTSDQEVHAKDEGKLRSYVPMHIAGRPLSALEFSESLAGERVVVRHAIFRALRAVGLVALAVGVVAAGLGVLLVARPMRNLVEHARRIGRGDLSPAAVPAVKDEFAELAREMNAMCAQLSAAQDAKWRALEQFRHAERLTTVGKLASGLAHELGTPLNVITLRANAIAQGRAIGQQAQEAAGSIVQQATRMTSLVQQLLDFARRKTPERDIVDVEDIVGRTTDLLRTVATKANVRFRVRTAGDMLKIRGNSNQLEQVLTNLLMNAIQAMPKGGTAQIAADLVPATPEDVPGKAGPHVRISVRDEGMGISAENLPHIFEPFFTTKDIGHGTGLGLAVCYGIVQDHGGWIDITTRVAEGSEFTVYLPAESS